MKKKVKRYDGGGDVYTGDECEGHGLIGKAPTKWEDNGELFVIQEVEV